MSKLLIVVDMQNDFVTGVLGTKEACNIVPDVVKLVDEFDGDIAFTKDTHHDNYLDTQEGKKLPVVHCIEGTDGWEIIPELKRYTTADNKRLIGIFNKPTFGSTELAKALSDKDYESEEYIRLKEWLRRRIDSSDEALARINLEEIKQKKAAR